MNERVKSYNNEFESFVSLIPPKYYNGKTLKDSWNKRKRTKEEARYLRKLKLDPDSHILFHENLEISNNIENKTNKKSLINKNKEKIIKNEETEKKEDILYIEKKPETQSQRASNISDLRAKLAFRIEQLRANRKASKSMTDGSAKNRDSILETRKRKKQTFLKEKKENPLKKEEKNISNEEKKHKSVKEESKNDEDLLNKPKENSLLYGRISFASDEDELKPAQKKYQSMDLAGALRHAEAKRMRLNQLSDEKKKQIIESDAWKKAFLLSEGKKVKDNETLLKKSMKRQERQKKKSAKTWNERLLQVSKAKQLRQKKREENIEARRTMRKKKQLAKKKRRPGFEGSLHIKNQNNTKTSLDTPKK
ncbi:unnamed protein product [Pneumocystis jirovecii]|uniref:Ribosomal RNA-processing protein 14/surfeit locus protein 6 C-terminal domain-containing protein n=1 Tax=Pneumocystis jirovecii TaxID=42068 RepID=L0PA68_PNEJI|nr:unnamed protein product [Pneumocystis jirovecii]